MRTALGCRVAVLISACAPVFAMTSAAFPVQKPTNADSAFRQIPLLTPSAGAGYVLNAGHITWPSLLENTALIHAIGAGDSVLIASTRGHGVSVNLDGSVTYTLPPKTFANRVGAIVTANDWTDPGDTGFPVLTASFTFGDGRTWGTGSLYDVSSDLGYPFLLGYRVRNWSDQVVPGDPQFVAHPLNPNVFELCARPSVGGVGNVFSDLQTFPIPDTLRNTSLSTVTFASHTVTFDGYLVTSATGLISGVAVWPQFEIVSRQNNAMAPQYQADQAYSSVNYGGYRDPLSGEIVGTYRNIQAEGCLLSNLAMTLSFVGIPVSVPALNDTLQRIRGYGGEVICKVAAAHGQNNGAMIDITAPAGKALGILPWHTFVIDRGGADYAGALATLLLVDSTHATVITHPDTTLPILPGQEGKVYRGVRTDRVLEKLTATQPFVLTAEEFRVSARPESLVEAALRDSLPSLVYVGSRGAPHWVLATGWDVAFGDSSRAHGTYDVIDPADTRGLSTLWALYGNQIGAAWVTRRLPGLQPERAPYASPSAIAVTRSELVLWLTGYAQLSLSGPAGQALTYNSTLDEYVTNIPGAIAIRSAAPGDPTRALGGDVPGDLIVLPVQGPTNYSLTVTSNESGSVALTGTHEVGGEYVGHGAAVATLRSGGKGYFNMVLTPGSVPPVNIVLMAVTGGVSDAASPQKLTLRVAPSPSATVTRVLFESPVGGKGGIEVFDLAGRRVKRLTDGMITPGAHVAIWDGRDDYGSTVDPGLYFVRLQVAGEVRLTRCVRVAP